MSAESRRIVCQLLRIQGTEVAREDLRGIANLWQAEKIIGISALGRVRGRRGRRSGIAFGAAKLKGC